MTDSVPQFEMTDTLGSTVHVNGPAGTTSAINIPTVAGPIISEILLMVDPVLTPASGKIELSFDGGTTWFPVFQGGSLAWSPKGNITQFKLKASNNNHKYYILINREPA